MKMKAFVLPPESRLKEVCSEKCRALLNEYFDTTWNQIGRDYTREELVNMISEAEVILTSWGSPGITEEALEKAVKLRAVGHAAGTVKYLVPKPIFSKGVRVFSAAPRIALSVGGILSGVATCVAALFAHFRCVASRRTVERAGAKRERADGKHDRYRLRQLYGTGFY